MKLKPALKSEKFARLRAALLANAIFSLSTGLGLMSFPVQLACAIGPDIDPVLIGIIGAGLLPFGAFVAWLSAGRQPNTLLALFVCLADLGWVAGSAIILAFNSTQLEPLGIGVISAVAFCVLGFALGQLQGIAHAFASVVRGRFLVCFDTRCSGSPETIWHN